MEVFGTLTKAGLEGEKTKYFFATVKPDSGNEWHVGVPSADVRKKAEGMVGKRVKATMKKGEKYWGLADIELADRNSGGSSRGSKYDTDTVGRQKARCSLVDSACRFFASANKTIGPQDIVETCKVFEAYVYEPSLDEIAEALGAEPVDDDRDE